MDASVTLINIVAVVVVGEFVAGPTADLSLATERALRVDAALSPPTVTGPQQTLVDIFTVLSIWSESEAFETGTGVFSHTLMGTGPLAWIGYYRILSVIGGLILIR